MNVYKMFKDWGSAFGWYFIAMFIEDQSKILALLPYLIGVGIQWYSVIDATWRNKGESKSPKVIK